LSFRHAFIGRTANPSINTDGFQPPPIKALQAPGVGAGGVPRTTPIPG